jgi:hypothetical protein
MKAKKALKRIASSFKKKVNSVSHENKYHKYDDFIEEIFNHKVIKNIIKLYDCDYLTLNEMLFEIAHSYYMFFKATRIEPLQISKKTYDILKDTFNLKEIE